LAAKRPVELNEQKQIFNEAWNSIYNPPPEPPAIKDQYIDPAGRFAIYNGDSCRVIEGIPTGSIGLIVESIPFCGLYQYSSDPEDMSNVIDKDEFFEHYRFLVEQHHRVLMPGRISAVHVMDIPLSNAGCDAMFDLPGEVIRVHESLGFAYGGRRVIWKEPLMVRNRTMMKSLHHKTLCEDSTRTSIANADYLLMFRRSGENEIPVTHETGLLSYAGENQPPVHLQRMRGMEGDQKLNQYSQYCWRQYASSVWMDIRVDRVLPHREAKDDMDEKHCLAAGSLVLTKTGYRPIESVNVGDEVLTHLGRWKPVTAKWMNGVREVVKVKAQGIPNLRLTADHQLLCRSGTGPGRWPGMPGSSFHPRKHASQNAPEWIQAVETKSHYLNLPLPPIEYSSLSEQDWWVIGRWLGDGHMDARGYPHISCSVKEISTLTAALGSRAGFTRQVNRGTMAVAVRDAGSGRRRKLTAFTEILRKCGRGAANKQLPPEAFGLEPSKSEALLSGYLSADGHFVSKHQRWTASSVSRSLLLGMAILAQRSRGVVASVYAGRAPGRQMIEGRDCNTLQDWILGIPPKNLSGMILDDGAWKKVRDIQPDGSEEVWDLEVADDHSFVAEGCVVHNCHPLQLDVIERAVVMWSNPGETVWTSFAGVGSELYGAVLNDRKAIGCELKSGYFLQAIANLQSVGEKIVTEERASLFDHEEEPADAAS